MTADKIIGRTMLRSLFDGYSHEFKETTFEQKTNLLATLNHHGFLREVIRDYRIDYKERDRHDIVRELNTTLYDYYIQKLNEEKYNLIPHKENLSLLIQTLKIELDVYARNHFTIDQLIQSFLDEDKATYQKQKKFFNVDFNEDISSKLVARGDEEKRLPHEQYIHLYSFLTSFLIPNYRNNRFIPFPIDNGADYQTEYLLRYFIKEHNKENYYKAIKHAIEVLYFGKAPYHKYVIFRHNLPDIQKVKSLYYDNEIAIHHNTPEDFEDWDRYLKGEKPKQQYIQRWKSLMELISKEDVIILASYHGIGYKMGKLLKDTVVCEETNEQSVYYHLKLQDAIPITADEIKHIQPTLPPSSTISNINKKHYSLRKLYPGVACYVNLDEVE